MSSHSNNSMAHDFYYRGVDRGESHSYAGCTLSYRKDTAVSYSTAVAKVVRTKAGIKARKLPTTREPSTGLTIVSYYPMSATTGRHISRLLSASPFECVRVPVGRSYDFTPKDVADAFIEALERLVGGFNTIGNRQEFAHLMGSRTRMLEIASEEWAKPLRDRRFRKYETIDIDKTAKELQERNRKAASKRSAETRALFSKYLPKAKASGADYCEFVKTLCEGFYNSEKFPFTYEQKRLFRSKLDRDAAYVWPDGDKIKTSRGISVPIDEARVLMKAWAAGEDMRKMQVARYTILKYEGDTVQIGCHKIPRENMLALYEAVMGEKFPCTVTPLCPTTTTL